MPDVDQECPVCRGRCGSRGTVYGVREGRSFCEERWLACPVCCGSGRVAVDAAVAFRQGQAQRADRIARRVTLRQEAERLGISPSEMGDREWGRG